MMPDADLALTLRALGWGPQSLAQHLHVNERTVRRWATGQNPTPQWVTEWLAKVLMVVEQAPRRPSETA
jgi:hypothetical protein